MPIVRTVGAHAAGIDRDNLELEALQMRDLDVRREGRQEQRDGVALLQQAVLQQRVEDVAHGRRAALDRKQVELAPGRTAVAHFLDQVVMDDLFGMHQRARRHGIVVADDAVGQFVDPLVGVEGLDLHAVLQHAGQEVVAVFALVLREKLAQAVGASLLCRHAGQNAIVAYAARLFHGKPAQQKEGVPRLGGDPVRIAAARVQHGRRGGLLTVLGQCDQVVLQLERR
ncbi:hypothetical protein D3C85_780690 [compost metagenome]